MENDLLKQTEFETKNRETDDFAIETACIVALIITTHDSYEQTKQIDILISYSFIFSFNDK